MSDVFPNINDTPEPWERQEDESQVAFEAFATYRDLGPSRSHREVGRILGKSRQLIGDWSSKYDWVKRTDAWDAEQDRIARQTQIDEIKDMRKRHGDLAKKILEKAERALDQIDDEDIRPGDVSRLVDIASKLERISRGDVGEVIEERDGGTATPAVTFYMPDNGRNKKQTDKEENENEADSSI